MTKMFSGFSCILFLILCFAVEGGAAAPGTLKWSYATGGGIYSSPAVGPDGTIYVGSRDFSLYAINPDGSLKWSYATGDRIDSSPALGPDGTIYVGSYDHKLYAITPGGSLKWIYSTGDYIRSSPAVANDGTIYVGSGDYKLHAVNPDGTFKWIYPAGYGIYASPAIGLDGTIYVGSHDAKVYVVKPDGTLKWSYDTEGGMISSSPAIGADGTVYMGSLNYTFYAFNPNGTLKWLYETTGRIDSSPAIGRDGSIYVGSGDHSLYIFSSNGGLKRKLDSAAGNFGSPPAIGSDGTVYVGSSDGSLRAIDPATGEFVSFYGTGGAVSSSPAIGKDGTIYFGSLDGSLYAVSGASPGPAVSAWPMFRHNPERTGDPTPQEYLTFHTTGTGQGGVTSMGRLMGCDSACIMRYTKGAPATLIPAPQRGSVFSEWTEGCKGNGTCSVVMTKPITVEAAFEPGACTYALTSTKKTFSWTGGTAVIGVTAKCEGSFCPVPEVVNTTGWITGTATAFVRSRGTVRFFVSPQWSSSDRASGPGEVSIDGQPIDIRQAGKPCSFTISPGSSALLSAVGDTGTFTVTATPFDCLWSVLPDARSDWITIDSGATGKGTGPVGYTAAANNTGRPRTGKIVVTVNKKNKSHTVRQKN